MRSLSRLAVLGTLAAGLVAAPGASAANTATAKVTPNKGGSIVVGAPTTFTVKASTPDTAVDPSGNTRIKAIVANLPTQLLFNTVPFKFCDATSFQANKTCPSATRIGAATILADGGPDVGVITATTELFFGSGFSVLAHVESNAPAIINEAVIGSLRSSGVSGYGLQMYIEVPSKISEPTDGLFPVVRSVDAKFSGPSKSVRIPGQSKKVKLPLVGLAPCKGALNFQVNVQYANTAGAITKTDSASAKAKCKK